MGGDRDEQETLKGWERNTGYKRRKKRWREREIEREGKREKRRQGRS